MLAIKLYTGNMVDCQLPEYKWSLSDFQKVELELHALSGRSSPTGLCEEGFPSMGHHPKAHLPAGKALSCNASCGTALSCVSGLSPLLHTLFLNKSSVWSFTAHRPSPELGSSSCPAGSRLRSRVERVKTRANCKHKPNPFQAPTCFNLLLITATPNLQM